MVILIINLTLFGERTKASPLAGLKTQAYWESAAYSDHARTTYYFTGKPRQCEGNGGTIK